MSTVYPANRRSVDVSVFRRVSAHLLLTASLATMAIGCSNSDADSSAEQAPAVADSHQVLAREILKELIEINTTDSAGDNTLAAEAMARRLLEAGFPAEDVEILAPAPHKGNLIARLRGQNPELKPLLLLAHLDVVEADLQSWSRDPFTFAEEEGYFYGRGVSDDKDEAAIHMANLIRLKLDGFAPRRDIVVALTADEEGGDFNGVQWLLATHPEKLRAEYVLSEGGGGVLLGGQRLVNEIQATEKQYQTFLIETSSQGGHSSMPPQDNAIYTIAVVADRLRNHRFPVQLNPVTRTFFERSSEMHTGPLRSAMEGVLREPPDQESINFLAQTPFYNAALRTTCTPTIIAGGHAENALPQRVTLTVNCRLLPTDSRDDVQEMLKSLVGDVASIRRVPVDAMRPGFSMSAAAFEVIERVSKSIWPDVPVVPIMGPGGTDGRFLRSVGIPVLGVNGVFIDVEDDRGHAADERMRVASFFEGLEFMNRLTREFSN